MSFPIPTIGRFSTTEPENGDENGGQAFSWGTHFFNKKALFESDQGGSDPGKLKGRSKKKKGVMHISTIPKTGER